MGKVVFVLVLISENLSKSGILNVPPRWGWSSNEETEAINMPRLWRLGRRHFVAVWAGLEWRRSDVKDAEGIGL